MKGKALLLYRGMRERESCMVVILLIIYGFLHLFRLISMDNANTHAYTLWIGVCTKTHIHCGLEYALKHNMKFSRLI
jgi:hypothetical protein